MYHELHDVPDSKKKDRVVLFDSITEFVTVPNKDLCKKVSKDDVYDDFKNGSHCGEPLSRWFDVSTRADFDRILANGDKKYTDMVLKNTAEVLPSVNIKRRMVRSDQGDDLDYQRVLCGNLDTAWARRGARSKVEAKNIRILCHVSMNSGVSAQKAVWRGVAALSVASSLEAAGYNVAIDVMGGVTDISSNENFAWIVPVKDYDIPLDITALSGVTCFPGFYRGPGFWNKGLVEPGDWFDHGGLGQSMYDDRIYDLLKKYYASNHEVLEFITKECLSSAACKSLVNDMLVRYGAEQQAA